MTHNAEHHTAADHQTHPRRSLIASVARAGLVIGLVAVGSARAGDGPASVTEQPATQLVAEYGPSGDAVGGAARGTDGFWLATSAGYVQSMGDEVPDLGGLWGVTTLNAPIVGVAPTATGDGYWMLGRDGGVFSFGDAVFHGSTGDLRLNQPIVSLASDPTGRGYWFVAADGGVFSFGAPFHGSTGDRKLSQPIVGMAPTTTGNGYWLVARDGGIFAFGDAVYSGSTGNLHLDQPIVGMAADPDGRGYWLLAADGEIFAFDAAAHGNGGAVKPTDPYVAMVAHPEGGYWLITSKGFFVGRGAAKEISNPPPDPNLPPKAFDLVPALRTGAGLGRVTEQLEYMTERGARYGQITIELAHLERRHDAGAVLEPMFAAAGFTFDGGYETEDDGGMEFRLWSWSRSSMSCTAHYDMITWGPNLKVYCIG